ncbi:MAG: fasciclin domain-containing protein [Thermoflexibacter sp.]
MVCACWTSSQENTSNATAEKIPTSRGQSSVEDADSQKDVVKVAVGSSDHTTLVTALKAAEYVDALSNAGPFTVFAPTNEAFNKLPAGMVEGLLKPEKKADLRTILEYHVYLGVINTDMMQDGQTLGQASGHNITLSVKDGKVIVNNSANIIASIRATNGVIHVIDAVLLPPQ